ncbi:MAG: hypothetical protein ABSH44_22075 [Bryobacteraceae bacterium]|jgi:hypothetical protein
MKMPAQVEYRLLREFARLFEGKVYKHRASNQGDFVAVHLYEDLVSINRSSKLIDAVVNRKDRVLNVQNKRRGVTARRGDGTFGEIIPGEVPITDAGYQVARGPIATVEIGVEVKILAKAMIKQIDRVINDLRNQAAQFKRGGGRPICVALVGINHAECMTSYEGDRPFPTTGTAGFPHPFQEAPAAERRLRSEAAPEFDEFLVLRFKATNVPPFPFEWVDYHETRLDYAAALSRISARYQQRS